jgi:1-acyl-sn-glycerol-3-phosphate acyltransferase
MGWKINGSLPPDLKKCILVAAPHTSYWDFVIARLAFYYQHVNARFLIKKELFKFPFKRYISWLGCIPVDKSNAKKAIFSAVEVIKNNDSIYLVITPEGTRKYTNNWKKGFYFIAEHANIPMVLTYVDYAKKEGGFGPIIYPSGNFEKDFAKIEDFYRTVTAKFPENFNLTPPQKLKNKN